MSLYAEKLDGVVETLRMVARQPTAKLRMALLDGESRLAIAVGSGGSAITANFLADCRRTLGYSPTLVMTPMEFVMGAERFRGAQIWLFSGSGENPDIIAAAQTCISLALTDVHVVTGRGQSTLAELTARCGTLYLTELADEKDGFLATHSLAGAIATLLFAADTACPRPLAETLVESFLVAGQQRLSSAHRESLKQSFLAFKPSQTLFVLCDPRLTAAAVAIETSCWEAALCPVQLVDFRNFAHGRHVWLEQRPGDAFLLALSSTETRQIWDELEASLPRSAPRMTLHAPFPGRLASALLVLEALAVVEALGEAVGRDPGKPGVGDFGRDVYSAVGLVDLATALPAPVRLKRAAVELFDPLDAGDHDLAACWTHLRETWATTAIEGLVLDYDGTIVTVEDREKPVPDDLVTSLVTLMDQGLKLGGATGRGDSAGRAMRSALPERLHPDVTIGYYNGGCVRTLDIDLKTARPTRPGEMEAVLSWLTQSAGFSVNRIKDGFVQLTLPLEDVTDMEQLAHDLANAGIEGLRLARSSHTVDICLRSTCKTSVVQALADRWGFEASSVLRVGDSGGPLGNDHVLLGSKMGVTVGEVCARPTEGWPMFGPAVAGPTALRRILKSLQPVGDGRFQIDLNALN
jgi:fructoselysine-6-P-deglycase FrlB-like protein/hydroxymethylpyrimidine pyrophosphatase-like HAD family hydrolase